MNDLESRLAFCEAELESVRIENEQLRRSAYAFAELAERLNRALIIASAAHAAIADLEHYSAQPAPSPNARSRTRCASIPAADVDGRRAEKRQAHSAECA